MAVISDKERSKDELIKELEEVRKLIPRLERLTNEYKEAEKLQAALYAITDLASSAEDMDDFYASLHRIVGKLMFARNFYIALFDREEQIVSFPYFVDSVDRSTPSEFPIEKIKRGLTAYILRRGEVYLGTREEIDGLVTSGEIDYVGEPPAYWLGVPLKQGQQIVGAIVVQSYSDENVITAPHKELLTFVSQHISTALERKWAIDELERRVEQRTRELIQANEVLQVEISERKRGEELQRALFRIAELTNTRMGMKAFYSAVHGIVGELLYAKNFYIALYDKKKELLIFPYVADEFDSLPKPRKLGKGLTEYVLKRGKAALLDRVTLAEMVDQGEVQNRGAPMQCWLGVPLSHGEEIRGVLAVQSYTVKDAYRKTDTELLSFVATHVATALDRKRASDALVRAHQELERRVEERTAELFEANRTLEHQIEERKRIEQQLIHDALHDALTGLPNRNLFMNRMEQAMKRMGRNTDYVYAVMFLDLDRFKIINDSLGHMVGDELLKDVARRIKSCMRDSDTVARLGGDEFAILLESIGGVEEAGTIAGRIRERLDEPFDLDNRQVFTSTSIGITMGHGHYTNPEDLLRDADAAMYRAKEQGRNRFEVFDESMHKHALSLLEMQNDLHGAVERNEFDVYYQPMVNVQNGRIVGFEALARWKHPKRGMILPGEFIPMAEETDLITSLDWCIIRKAVDQLSKWLEDFPEMPDLVVSVNVSSRHFAQVEFAEKLRKALEYYKLGPKHLKLEVREGALLDNLSSVNEVLQKLSDLNVRLLLDDFGTRYSSLSYLHRFPMETLKIDRTFVTNMLEVQENQAIVRTIKALAETLDMNVVAEGVESEAVYMKVEELGCHIVQGFYISEPVDVKKATAMLAKGGKLH